jgi:hypothetical protein
MSKSKRSTSKVAQDPAWEHVYKSSYTSKCFWDVQWLSVADDLLESASILESQVREVFERLRAHAKDQSVRLISHGVLSIHFMLLSYAIENLFKAGLVRMHSHEYKEDFESKKKFPDELRTHDLVSLARATGFTLDLNREDLLRRLTRSAQWHGRYPAPLDYREMSGSEIFGDGKIHSVSHFGGNDLDRLKTLIRDIRLELGLKSNRTYPIAP